MGLSGLVPEAPPSLLGLFELAIEKTPESAWLAGESLLEASRGDSEKKYFAILHTNRIIIGNYEITVFKSSMRLIFDGTSWQATNVGSCKF